MFDTCVNCGQAAAIRFAQASQDVERIDGRWTLKLTYIKLSSYSFLKNNRVMKKVINIIIFLSIAGIYFSTNMVMFVWA